MVVVRGSSGRRACCCCCCVDCASSLPSSSLSRFRLDVVEAVVLAVVFGCPAESAGSGISDEVIVISWLESDGAGEGKTVASVVAIAVTVVCVCECIATSVAGSGGGRDESVICQLRVEGGRCKQRQVALSGE